MWVPSKRTNLEAMAEEEESVPAQSQCSARLQGSCIYWGQDVEGLLATSKQ